VDTKTKKALRSAGRVQVLYFALDGVTSVASSKDPHHHYTQVGNSRTRRDGPPEHLVDGKWVPIPSRTTS
jgi:hypothetical protein